MLWSDTKIAIRRFVLLLNKALLLHFKVFFWGWWREGTGEGWWVNKEMGDKFKQVQFDRVLFNFPYVLHDRKI